MIKVTRVNGKMIISELVLMGSTLGACQSYTPAPKEPRAIERYIDSNTGKYNAKSSEQRRKELMADIRKTRSAIRNQAKKWCQINSTTRVLSSEPKHIAQARTWELSKKVMDTIIEVKAVNC
jgi:hypothetical protein